MEPTDRYFIFENRLDSFRVPQVVSSKGKAAKTLAWPHKTLSPVALAKAGFFYEPHLKSPDNVVCFLCEKSLDGWEENDNPVGEHLKHSPTCGWAIMAAIEAGYGNYGKVHPLDPAMVEARKATFAGRWPYESKKGFKCKTKKLVEGGWKYTPSLEADDMTTCAYCDLALEGWESDDNPFDEHYKRKPGCLFFALINQYPAPKKGRGRAARTSKASRLSVQSVATVATTVSDLTSTADVSADHDDSVMTTASTMTQGGRKTAKGRKPVTGKGRKTKAKKEEAVDILEDGGQELQQQSGARGHKRASDAMEDPSVVNAEAPASKKRATKARASMAADTSSIIDADMGDALPAKQPASRKRASASTAKTKRMTSRASVTSQASTASLRAQMPDDDELERQLEADLERYNSDADGISVEQIPPPARGRPKKATTARKVSVQKKKKAEHDSRAVLDPTPMVPNDAEIEADFEAIQAGMEVEQIAAAGTLAVPKKGRKAGTRKVSRQISKAKEPVPPSEPAEAEEVRAPEQAQARDIDAPQPQSDMEMVPAEDPNVSTETVLTKPVACPSNEKRRRGRPSKKSTASEASVEDLAPRPSVEASGKVAATQPRESIPVADDPPDAIFRKPAPASPRNSGRSQLPASVPATTTPQKSSKTLPAPPSSSSRLPQPPSTPRTRPSLSARSNNQTTGTTRTRSPQSSDAENQPPTSLQPAASVLPKRVALAPLDTAVAQTPNRNSPSRRNIISGLQSSHPWEPADLDLLFSSSPVRSPHDGEDDKENGHSGQRGVAKLLRKGAELTSPEKRMTVEEWIYHNAELAEQKLKRECEAMVAAFEAEGMRALKVLEGLVVEV
ncbi:uncharacterized protein P884DRAFT_223292 [Thermothelomyces heterothallicus CBS 202.75]|uniref:uncharacterized protein n=1 Tax=Thermothelomyces heterothallicus CBS 202.75 TaxID=1149848 RepID=UPI00374416FE